MTVPSEAVQRINGVTSVFVVVVGGALALLMRGMPFSISAAVGFIAVSGVATLTLLMLPCLAARVGRYKAS